ncbi:MAG: lysophospholipid acyltransferase family protein [Prochloraceae cyanobacterium]
MFSQPSVLVSQTLLRAMGMQMFVYYRDRIPQDTATIVISNHRSFMDALVLMVALERTVRIACHHYMGQVPVLREMVHLLGCFPLEKPGKRQQHFFKQAMELLTTQQWVGLFPEGGLPMVELTQPTEVGKFQRGFAHLALRTSLPNVAVLPVAIASVEETVTKTLPLKFLHLLDPSEPLFDRPGLHPVVIYNRANVSIGRPYWITAQHREQYRGKGAKQVIEDLTSYCQHEIATLVDRGCN